MAYLVYVIQTMKDGSYCVGATSNIEKRLANHNSGGSQYTRSRAPWRVVLTEEFPARSEALQRERAIKKRKSRRYIDELLGGQVDRKPAEA